MTFKIPRLQPKVVGAKVPPKAAPKKGTPSPANNTNRFSQLEGNSLDDATDDEVEIMTALQLAGL